MRYSIPLFRVLLPLTLMPGVHVAVTAQELPAERPTAEEVARGAELFSRFCQHCHNARGPAERTEREWVIIIQHMAARADLTRNRAELIRAFLQASSGERGAPGEAVEAGLAPNLDEVTPPMIEAGREIYFGKGGCVGCHGAALEGGAIAPDLRDAHWQHGSGRLEEILRVIRTGVPGTVMPAYSGGISDEEARRVAVYVWAVASGRAEPR